ncbi:MAG: Ig-like domain repeat protein [Edaphobacter sp.]
MKAAANYGKIPLSFEQNHGQAAANVQFMARGQGYGLFLTEGEAVLELEHGGAAKDAKSATLRMTLEGANQRAVANGLEPLADAVNYYVGNDPAKWTTAAKTFGRVSYGAVYPGIDLVYYGNQRQLEYDFVVAAGADPSKIALKFSGAKAILDQRGDLLLTDGDAHTSFRKPVVYQMKGDARVPVMSSYKLDGQQVSFNVGAYDRTKPLVIDPVLTYATFLGGNLNDIGVSIAADSSGNSYIVGDTASYNFPVANAAKGTNTAVGNGWNLFVTKLNPAGTAIVFSTYLGGIADSHAGGIALDPSNNVYVVGYTNANDYPVTSGAFQTLCGASRNGQGIRQAGCGISDDISAVLTKLTSTGTIVFSTFLGDESFPYGVAVDAAGEAYVTGNTQAYCGKPPYYPTGSSYSSYQCFPVTSGAFQDGTLVAGGGGTTQFAFLTKFSADGSTLLYSTLYGSLPNTTPSGGQAYLHSYAVAIDSSGNAYIAGNAGGAGAPTTAGSFYNPPANTSSVLPPQPAFVAKFNPTLSGSASLVYATFLGSAAQSALASNWNDTATGIAVDASGDAIVVGYVSECGFPTTTGAYEPTTGSSPYCQDGFITKLNPTGTGLIWSTLYGTNPAVTGNQGNTKINGVAQGATGNIYVTGTFSVGGGGNALPFVNPIATVVNGGAFVAEVDPTGSKLIFASPLSGYGSADSGAAVAVDPSGNMYLTGKVDAATPTTPITPGAFQQTYGGGAYDAYVVKIAPQLISTTAVALSSATATAGAPVTFTATVAGVGTTSVPTGTVTFLNGTATLGTGTLGTAGTAVFTTSTLAVGTYSVTARYAGDTTFNASSATTGQALTVTTNVTTTALAASATTALTGTSITFTATVAPANGTIIPTGTVTFKDGTTVLGTGTLSGAKATYATTTLAAGSHSITASYGGDSNDVASVSTATVVTITLSPPDFSIAFNSPTGTITAGSSATITITETPVNGFAAPTTFACSGLPTFATCTFSPSSLTPTSTTPVTTTLTIATNVATANLTMPVLPFANRLPLAPLMAGLLLLPMVALRKRKLPRLMMAILAGLLMLAPTGCASNAAGSQKITPKGAYPVTVTATAGTTSHTQVYTITVQ